MASRFTPPSRGIGKDVVNLPVDTEWLALHREEALQPKLPIVDPHHHLWDRPGARYMPPDLIADIRTCHNIVATVYIENGVMYRPSGPAAFRCVGETEVAARLGDAWTAGPAGPRICEGIVAHADLCLGAAVKAVLEAHIEAGASRVRGIRQVTSWDRARALQLPPLGPRGPIPMGMLMEPQFRQGFAQLAPMGLSFDACLYHPQLPEVVDLAHAFPDTSIVVDHIGCPLRVGPYQSRTDEVFADWSAAVGALARCPNVSVKIGGLGMRLFGFGLHERPTPPSSQELADLWRPYVENCIEAFGADRSMFESNFPVDKAYYDYCTVWNAFKRLASSASCDETDSLFSKTAARVYGLTVPAQGQPQQFERVRLNLHR